MFFVTLSLIFITDFYHLGNLLCGHKARYNIRTVGHFQWNCQRSGPMRVSAVAMSRHQGHHIAAKISEIENLTGTDLVYKILLHLQVSVFVSGR